MAGKARPLSLKIANAIQMNIITPIFPCLSLDELLTFYQSLGFDISYYQKSPNPYACLTKGWIRIDFYGIKHHDPKKVYHTCYILTDEVDELYESFSDALRAMYGKLPTRGLPRISEIRDKTNDGVREFKLVDIAGTCLRFGKKLAAGNEEEQYSKAVASANNRLLLALDYAYKKEDEADELAVVSRLLDKAIEKERHHACINLYKVMTLRADIAIEKREYDLAGELLKEVKTSEFLAKRKDKSVLKRVADLELKLQLVKQQEDE